MNYHVLMKLNRNYKSKKKNETVDVVVSFYDNKGDAMFSEITEEFGGYSYGIKIPEKYLDVITREKDPEYFL